MEKIYISYRRSGVPFAVQRIRDFLCAHLGEDLVRLDIAAVSSLGNVVRTAVRGCEVLLAVIDPDWLDQRDAAGRRHLDDPDYTIRVELELGLRSARCAVIPVLLGKARMPEACELPESLGPLCSLQPVRVDAHHFESDMGSLAHRLTTILESRNRIGPGTSKPLGVDPAQGCDGAGDRGAGATEPPPSFSAPVSRMDHVHFAETSASEMACGESHVVSVWVFPEPRHKDLAERALAEHGTDSDQLHGPG